MVATRSVVHSDPEIMSGTPMFLGIRVPVDALFDYLAAGDPLERFLDDFPSVTREQAVETVGLARDALYAIVIESRTSDGVGERW